MTTTEYPSYYAIIPANVRYDKTLKANEKLLYGEITCLTQSTGKCFASNDYFANLYGTSKETISRWISNLAQQGYIKTQLIYKDGTKQIINRYIEINQEGIDKIINSPIDEKVKDNNTSINTSSVDYDEYKNLWNEFATKHNKTKVAKLTAVRKKQITTRLKDYSNFLEIFKYVLIKSEKSDFLLESDFFKLDWLIKNDNNIIKVYEGDYDNRKPKEVII